MTRPLSLCAALLLATTTASAQGQAVAPASTHPYQPGIDVVDYEFQLDLPDTGAFLRGDATITAARAPGVALLRLDLVSALTVRAVTVNDARVDAVRDGATIRVPLDAARGDTVRVRVRYDGVVTDGLVARRDARGRWTWFGDNWPDRTRQWLPTVDHPSDKATVGFTVRAPETHTVVANGTQLGAPAPAGPGRRETRWREARPIPAYLMVIGVSEQIRVDIADGACVPAGVHRCVPQVVYAKAETRGYLPGPFAAAPAIVSYFEELVGPFPYEKLAHLQSATRFGGMENASAIFYADRLFAERSMTEGLIAHETAHQWFGDAVTEREWAHLWLSEGFATYFAALWTRRSRGDAAFAAQMAEIRAQILADSVVATRPVLDTLQRDYLALLNANSYQKGGYVLWLLHQRLGDSAFFGGLRRYYARHRDGTALTDDLRQAMEEASGQQLGPFFEQWLRRPGVPEARVGWAHDASTGTLSIAVLQDGRARPYALSLPVVVVDSLGTETRITVEVPAERRATVVVPGSFGGRPRGVRIDPGGMVLGRLESM